VSITISALKPTEGEKEMKKIEDTTKAPWTEVSGMDIVDTAIGGDPNNDEDTIQLRRDDDGALYIVHYNYSELCTLYKTNRTPEDWLEDAKMLFDLD
jgi:hypothetical protein